MSSLEERIFVMPADNYVVTKGGAIMEISRGKHSLRNNNAWAEQENDAILNPGMTSGNHYHLIKREIIWLMHGPLLVYFEDIKTKEKLKIELMNGQIITLPTEVAHAFHNPNNYSAFFTEKASLAFNPNNPKNDVYPYQLT